MKIFDEITGKQVFGYFAIWFGGSFVCMGILASGLMKAETLFIIIIPLLFFSFARIQYLEDLLKVFEKKLGGG